ncbi:hypothetical protein HP439_17305 [Sphingobacterium shayense]|uniref:hypothetical protein n=1 Tax=Sphingobacterium shayense TaxID=626343 RepID=UPI001557C649|nr:hypothetical protein [Sphingobacterium shayense]NQD72488.1 hypothetical protein [Sphingobacterium shayense]
MKFKIGDLVRFVDEPIEGHITSFQPNDIIGVTDDSGFEIPVLASKLTLVHGNMRHIDDQESTIHPTNDEPFVFRGIYLAISGEQKDGLAKFYIINHSSFDLLIAISESSGNKQTALFGEHIVPKDFIQFHTANFNNIGKWPNMTIQIIRYSRTSLPLTQPLVIELKVKPVDLLDLKETDEIMDSKVWRFELDKPQENINIDKLKDHFISHRPKKR